MNSSMWMESNVHGKRTTSQPGGLEPSRVLFFTMLWVGRAVPCWFCLGSLTRLHLAGALCWMAGPRRLTHRRVLQLVLAVRRGTSVLFHMASHPLVSEPVLLCGCLVGTGFDKSKPEAAWSSRPGFQLTPCLLCHIWPNRVTVPAQIQGWGN